MEGNWLDEETLLKSVSTGDAVLWVRVPHPLLFVTEWLKVDIVLKSKSGSLLPILEDSQVRILSN